MTLAVTKKNLFLSSAVVMAFFTLSGADAGIIKIKNHSQNNIEVEIAQEVSSGCGTSTRCSAYCWKCLGDTFKPNAQRIKNIIVP